MGIWLLAGSAVAQENQGQMGTQPRPAVTTPATQAHPDKDAQTNQTPTTPTTPQSHPQQDPNAVEKPESAVGGTQPPPPPPQALPAEPLAQQDAGALQLVQPDAQELRSHIEQALQREPSLQGANIVLNISDTTIDIAGNANTPRQRLTARRIVQSFAGNRKVQERITVAGMAPRTEPQTDKSEPVLPKNAPAQTEQPKPDNRPKSEPEKQGDASGRPR
jgi:hypothetical protein